MVSTNADLIGNSNLLKSEESSGSLGMSGIHHSSIAFSLYELSLHAYIDQGSYMGNIRTPGQDSGGFRP